MRRALIVFTLAQFFAASSSAHDFWLEPERFMITEPDRIEVRAQVGHAGDVGEWPADPGRVTALRLVSDSGITDVQNELASRQSAGRFSLTIAQPGVNVLALESNGAVSELPAAVFNDYLEEEGLTPIARHRAAEGLNDAVGREVYSRRAKAILVSGPLPGGGCNTKTLTPIGMTLEISPLVLPACTSPGDNLPIEVRYRGTPLAGATVHLVRLGAEGGDAGKWLTGAKGLASIPHPGPGNWMLQTVWSSPLTGDPRGDYDTVFSSLSFALGTDGP